MPRVLHVEDFLLWQRAAGRPAGTIRNCRAGRRRHLQHYLIRRVWRPCGHASRDVMFMTEDGRPSRVEAAEKSFKNMGRRIGLPHLLRHMFAAQSLAKSAGIPAVMRLGEWRKVSTLQRYSYVNDAVAVELHGRTSPSAGP